MEQNQLQNFELQKIIDDNIVRIFNEFDVKVSKNFKYYTGICPIHYGADNPTAFCFSHNEDKKFNCSRWSCNTHGCHDYFIKTSLGFVRGLLSSRQLGWKSFGDRMVSFHDTIHWCKKFFSLGDNDLVNKSSEVYQKKKEIEFPRPLITLTREELRGRLRIPSNYFLTRGFSPAILDSYDVGSLKVPLKSLYFREFVPIYDFEGKYCIGATARSIFEKCPECKSYHDPNYLCPEKNLIGVYPKWKNWQFSKNFSLYNYWNARKFIQERNCGVLVESPGNIWKLLEANITNCIGMYGIELSSAHKFLLDKLGFDHLCICLDNDGPGEKAFQRIGKELWQTYNIHRIKIPNTFNDLGELSSEVIGNYIKPQIDKWNRK